MTYDKNDPHKPLTPKQDLFIKYYLANGMNATQAAISAGYSPKSANEIGSENLAKPNIRHTLGVAQKSTAKKVGITKESLIADLVEIVQTYKLSGANTKDAIRAIENLAKMLGYNEADKVDISGINFNYVTPPNEDQQTEDKNG